MENRKILSYDSVVLRDTDLTILKGPYFLNDRIIEFYLSYLGSSVSSNILLVAPSVSFWIQHSPSENDLLAIVQPLSFPQKELIVFPINDNDDVNTEGGSHWSMLVYDRKRNIFEHYDSMSGLNSLNASRLFHKVVRLLGPPAETAVFAEHFTPHQQNNYDCGVYVLAIVKELCSYYEKGGNENWDLILKEQVTPQSVSCMRREILNTVLSLASKI